MANEPIITIAGNLTGDPELRYVSSGTPVASFTVASTPRSLNRQTNQWEDGEAMFVRCSAWKDYAENVTESLTRGMRVVVTGRMTVRSYEHNGQQRTSIELQVDEVGPSLRYARAQVTRVQSGHTTAQAPQDRFSGPNSQNPGGFTTPAPNAPQGGVQDPAGNLGQSGLWGQPNAPAPF